MSAASSQEEFTEKQWCQLRRWNSGELDGKTAAEMAIARRGFVIVTLCTLCMMGGHFFRWLTTGAVGAGTPSRFA